MTTENHIIPVEATTSNYPGANALKTHLPSNPIFQHICEALEGTTTPIAFDVVGIQEPTLKKTIR